MKVIQVLSTAMLFLLPGAMISAYAQEPHEPEKQPQQKQQQAKPAPQQAKPAEQPQHAQQQAKPAPQQAKPAAQPQHAQQQAKPAPQQAKPAQPQHAQQQAKPAEQQHAQQQAKPAPQQAKPAAQPQHAQQQAKPAQQQARPAQAAAGHGRIPDDRYRASFGSGHTFHVNRADFAGGPGRFQYGGYWFSAVNPWPLGWLYTDNVYVDYMDGGYFLCDPIHPGVFLSINVG